MKGPSGRHRFWEPLAYWSQWTLLQMFGPATQDEQTDPVARLKRAHNRD